MLRALVLLGILLCPLSSFAAPILVIDNPTQIVLPGGSASFTGSVTFDAFMPFGAAPALSPPVPAGFQFLTPIALAGPFSPGNVYSGLLFGILVPQNGAQSYSALATVGGVSNPVLITLNIVPEPATAVPFAA